MALGTIGKFGRKPIKYITGLQGHLSSLAMVKVFEYLKSSHAITSTGLLLGLGCAKVCILTAMIMC